ncbi:MAG: hypothetical protein M1817_004490 [Caeruleum heppii]|nr:MAG: hypothetical protein M1817_004490 [Caeruleum heppii]
MQSRDTPTLLAQETALHDVFLPPSIDHDKLVTGRSYCHHSPIPELLSEDMSMECVLGVDEAGRGPVLGPMVYGLLYLPLSSHRSLLASTHHFDDSKVLTPQVRSRLMQNLCTPSTDLFGQCGWATTVMSARDISAGMLKAAGTFNLNAQAMDVTIDLIKDVFAKGINVREIYIDTIGSPQTYQNKLSRIFPTTSITVAKKADSLYPCVSAASVCAKVTRDAALEVCYETYRRRGSRTTEIEAPQKGWGSGYPSDARCSSWLRRNMDPVFGWGNECRFSWGTAKDLLEARDGAAKIDWPDEDDDDSMRVTDFFSATTGDGRVDQEMSGWYGSRVPAEVF